MVMGVGEPTDARGYADRHARRASSPAGAPRRLVRNRRGKSPRNSLYPPGVPWHRNPTELFESYMLESAERLEELWGTQVSDIAFVLMDAPMLPSHERSNGDEHYPTIPLGAAYPADKATPSRIILYRLPIQHRSRGTESLAALIHDVTVEQFATLTAIDPKSVDARYRYPEERF